MIATDVQTFHQHQDGGNVTGVIYVELGSGPYPEKAWSDFPVIILSWWADALHQMRSDSSREVHWSFMDGPCSLKLTKVSGKETDGALTLGKVEDELIETAKRVIAHCDVHNMRSRDLETLREHLRRLQANQSSHAVGFHRSIAIDIQTSR